MGASARREDTGGNAALMRGWALTFPGQVREAIAWAEERGWPPPAPLPRSVFLGGMGGSAMACQLAQAILAPCLPIPTVVGRDPEVPQWVGADTWAIAVSYSGETWEARRMLGACRQRGAHCLAVAGGGSLSSEVGPDASAAFLLPGGLVPRAALGWMLAPLLLALGRAGGVEPREELAEGLSLLEEEVGLWREGKVMPGRDPVKLADHLRGKLVLVYAAGESLYPAAVRWRGQLQENAKQMAVANAFPELSHNEIMGWPHLCRVAGTVFLLLEGGDEDPWRVGVREAALAELARSGGKVVRVPARGRSPAAQLLGHCALADLTTVEMARQAGVDPLSVDGIERVKAACGKELFP